MNMTHSFKAKPLLISAATVLTFTLFYISSRLFGPAFQLFDSEYTFLDRLTEEAKLTSLYPSHQAKTHFEGIWGGGLAAIFNTTLGFQAINLISLPERTDKRDAFAVAASFSGFDYNVTDGVVGSQVSAKAKPYKMNQDAGQVGCWRAHLNVWEAMVHNGLSSALVFEDDADWDLGLRAQLVELAKGTRFVLGDSDQNRRSPYGDKWDLLWIGHCGTVPAPWNEKRWIIPHDPTVVPPENRLNVIPGTADISRYELDGVHNTRVIAQAFGGVCTTSYAISLAGARKALYRLSMQPYNSPIDLGLKDLCADKSFSFLCVTPYPQIVGNYFPPGNHSSWSDIADAVDIIEEKGQSWSVAFSTKLNLERLLQGDARFTNTFPKTSAQEMTIQEITQGVGHEEIAPVSRYAALTDDELRQIQWEDGLPF